MALDISLDIQDEVATITLEGELDTGTAPKFKEKIEEASKTEIKKLVLDMTELTYMSSAGLRVLVFSQQKMPKVKIVIIGVQEMVFDTIKKTGLDKSFEFKKDEN